MATRSLPPAAQAPSAPDGESERIAELEERIRRLEKINAALVDRVERSSDMQGNAFSMFETAISLEAMVRDRTAQLEDALASLNAANADLGKAHRDADFARARLRDAIESLSDGFALFDADDRLVMCNRAYASLWPEIEEMGDDPPRFDDIAQSVARNRRVVGALRSPERWVADRVARHSLAEGVHIQALTDGRWVQISEIRTSEGGTVSIYTDITEVKAEDARERARELAERNLALQAMIDTLSEGVCLYDANRRLLAHNGGLERLLGLKSGDGRPIADHAQLVSHCLSRGMGCENMLEWRDAPGERREAHCSFDGREFLIRSTPIQPDGMAFSFDDVTDRLRYQETLREAAETLERRVAERTTELETEVAERRAVEAQLLSAKTAAEQANRSKTSFLAAASHDLLQPLNAARLFVSALGERRLALPTRALVRQTAVALDSVEDLLEALFEISRLDSGAIQPDVTAIPLDQILSALRIEFAAIARGAGLALEIPDTALWVRSDLRMLRRVLQNFLSNAVRYTSKGTVSIHARAAGDTIEIDVSDTGPGIPADKLDTIFEEFRRLDGSAKIPGKGLGLAIVRRTSAMLGHEIDVHSREGEGSIFTIRVPKAEPSSAAETGKARRRFPASDSGRILIVDNDEAILSGMKALLENWGYAVQTARDAADPAAIAAAREGIDLILADYHLDEDRRGDQAIIDLRAIAGSAVPGAVITADRSEEVKSRVAAEGFPQLNKPVKPAQLRALLRTLLAK
ncbi:NahK/ErcS family hybrid sensor histidine kinase/response regulator [Novosphingobium sp. ZN18A2]|uniref:hybrid sensor histidine kinase/response regulator n=1 Tax=Novosphingobium sp. ZN18A2 TaxID=3079861 RepID=UPI0030D02B73